MGAEGDTRGVKGSVSLPRPMRTLGTNILKRKIKTQLQVLNPDHLPPRSQFLLLLTSGEILQLPWDLEKRTPVLEMCPGGPDNDSSGLQNPIKCQELFPCGLAVSPHRPPL